MNGKGDRSGSAAARYMQKNERAHQQLVSSSDERSRVPKAALGQEITNRKHRNYERIKVNNRLQRLMAEQEEPLTSTAAARQG